ncbi:MAG TPA: ABC transporter ATP-binding protein [Paracoccaceae bacterium]|nr:ABC transporter ATP-binding protein [Paracoccaceae bacterium]
MDANDDGETAKPAAARAPDPDAAISVRGLRKVYRSKGGEEKVALAGVDLDVPEGSIFGLLGPNGAGKSTFINILAGLVTKTEGTVRIWGFDQDANPRQSRAAIGVVPQELNVDPFFPPYAALEMQAGLYGVPKRARRTEEILRKVGLWDKRDAYARTLSGGMRRRLLVAKALVHNPAVLVLDEPTAGVDIELRRMLWDYVRELHAEGVTVILTTHYLEEAEELCDRIAVIDRGAVIADEPTGEMVARLDRKTLVIQPASPLERAPAMPEGVEASLREDGSLALVYRRTEHDAGRLLALAADAGVRVRDLRTEEPDLEDAFVSLVRGHAED